MLMHRISTEHQMATTKRLSELAAASSSTPLPPTTNDIHLIDLPHAHRFPVSLTGKAFERTLLWRLDWWNFLYFPFFLLFSCPLSKQPPHLHSCPLHPPSTKHTVHVKSNLMKQQSPRPRRLRLPYRRRPHSRPTSHVPSRSHRPRHRHPRQ